MTCISLFSITLIRLPILLGHVRILQSAAALVLAACVAWAIPRPRTLVTHKTLTLVTAYTVLLSISLIRGSEARVYNSLLSSTTEAVLYLLVVAFAFTLVTTSQSRAERDRRLTTIVLAPVVYVSINLVLHFAGVAAGAAIQHDPNTIASELGAPDQALALIGVHAGRTLFPLATSINLFGVICAAGLTGALVLMRYAQTIRKRWLVVGALACLVGILLGDSRGPLAVAIAVALYFVLSKRHAAATWVTAILPALPLVLVGALNLLESLGVATVLSRGGGGNFATATGRTLIWGDSWNVFHHPALQQLIGWGANGQITSGASIQWAYLFRGILDSPVSANTHDVFLQTIFDTGYIGLLALLAAVMAALASLARQIRFDRASPAWALRAMLLTLLICGVTEAAPTYLSQEALVEMLLIMGAAAGLAITSVAPGDRLVAARPVRPNSTVAGTTSVGGRARRPAGHI